MRRFFNVCIAGVMFAACGGDATPNLGPEAAPTPAQQTAIMSTEQSLTQLAAVDTQGSAAAVYALDFATSELLLIEPGSGASAATGPSLAGPIEPRVVSALRLAPFADCAVVSPNSIVWHQCMDSGITIDGMISWSTGHVDLDLHLFGTSQSVTFDYKLTGSMTVSASAIQGDMTLAVTASAGGDSVSQMVHSQIDVQITNGCISSGTLTVTASGSGTGAQNGALQVVWTGCQMFRVRNG
jgi:hypothetical protein